MEMEMQREVYSEPSDVEGYGGEVMVEGPDGVDVSLTPEAAIITGTRLINAGVQEISNDKSLNKPG
ncbi:hypothetical protein ASG11_17870 [Sphingomonas sp. Leaf357]|nr:hypothetical protein ASG11_17870 [Sphingomonas sp. Leaf357]